MYIGGLTGKVGINDLSPSYKLDVKGTIRGYGITDSSDLSWKKNITTLGKPLDKIAPIKILPKALKSALLPRNWKLNTRN